MTYDAKYGVRAVAGGGRSSARETIGRYEQHERKKENTSRIRTTVDNKENTGT